MKLFSQFDPTTNENWRALVEKELKGLAFDDVLQKQDDIEGITIQKYSDNRSALQNGLQFTRSAKSRNNDWFIGISIDVKDEKIANSQALTALNQGANSITFVLLKKEILWSALFAEIELNYIETQFKTIDNEQTIALRKVFQTFTTRKALVVNDSLFFSSIDQLSKEASVEFAINAFGIHQLGANATQEIAFALSAGHAKLHELLNLGSNIDEAAAMIRFEMGIGANYFIETTKFRVFRKLWANVVDAYHPKENCSHSCFIYAKSGFVNKSLKDPYTNILRQTTEAMSAILGGANELQIQAYDKYQKGADRSLSERMALNISNLLKEESYFDKVIDPLGGSYSIGNLTEQISQKAWHLFKEIEKKGGAASKDGQAVLTSQIANTVEKRIAAFKANKRILIGVNTFPNPDEKTAEWMEIPSYLGMNALILEKL